MTDPPGVDDDPRPRPMTIRVAGPVTVPADRTYSGFAATTPRSRKEASNMWEVYGLPNTAMRTS